MSHLVLGFVVVEVFSSAFSSLVLDAVEEMMVAVLVVEIVAAVAALRKGLAE